jgi:hypothetical protein
VRRIVVVIAVMVVSWAVASGLGAGVSAQAPHSGTDVTVVDGYDLVRPPSECIGFLPLPDCGKPPVDAGERGGALQYVTFGVILAAMGFIFTVVFRNVVRSDRAKAQRAYAAEAAQAAEAAALSEPGDPNRTLSSP